MTGRCSKLVALLAVLALAALAAPVATQQPVTLVPRLLMPKFV